MYKIIFSDIDRTLAVNGVITDENIKAIRDYVSLGNKFVLVSGRTINYTSNISKKVGASNYIICNNGSVVYDYLNKKIIYENRIKRETLLKIFNIAKKYDARCVFGGINTTYTNKMRNKDFEYEINNITDELYINNPITQITITHKKKDIILSIINEINLFNDIYISSKSRNLYDDTYNSNNNFRIDITPLGTNKGIAIVKLLEYLNINLKKSIRVGDDLNDLPMFLEEGLNVCVDNAFSNLKSKADYITDSCENSGVAKLIDKVINKEIWHIIKIML